MTALIWKYAIDVAPWSANGGQIFSVPVGAIFRHCAAQHSQIAIWMEVDPDAATEQRWFRFYGTGYAIQGDDLTYLGTTLFVGGDLVLHVYEARYTP